MNACKIVASMVLKSDLKRHEVELIRPITEFGLSLYLFQATTFTTSHFGSTQESFYLV